VKRRRFVILFLPKKSETSARWCGFVDVCCCLGRKICFGFDGSTGCALALERGGLEHIWIGWPIDEQSQGSRVMCAVGFGYADGYFISG